MLLGSPVANLQPGFYFDDCNVLAENDLQHSERSGSCPDESEIADPAGIEPFPKVSRRQGSMMRG